MSASPSVIRFQIGVLALGAFGAVLLWGCWLIYGARIGTSVCEHYTYVLGGANPKLDAWCNGQNWRGWLAGCLAAAAAAVFLSTLLALRSLRRAWLAAGALLAAGAVWAGFALPQTLAGPDRTSQQAVRPPATLPSAPERLSAVPAS